MASTRDWFETIAEAQRRAQRQLPRGVYLALVAGAETGQTMNENITAFSRLKLRPHVADLPAQRDLATTVMGLDVSFPVICSPTGVQAVHPDGEVAVARAAQAAGHRGGPVLVRVQAGRRGRPGDRQAAVPELLGRQP